MITTHELDNYIKTYSSFNVIPPQLKKFIVGLKALSSGAIMRKFTFNGLFYTIILPQEHYVGACIQGKTRKFIADALVKKDIKVVSVYEFNDILEQILVHKPTTYLPTYQFLRNGYNDKCRHTVIKYYSLDNPKH